MRKSPEVILGHLGAYGVKFRTSPIVDKLYLKMKLLARAFQKNLVIGSKKSSKVKNREKRLKKSMMKNIYTYIIYGISYIIYVMAPTG